ncbi:MAG TPA: aldehyde ferredoxin oxidoreductase family protein [Candidatus Kryptonia bacterium]|nr:aldehyde ferredoxin oxidoreductase family protein [Candidatus Kryptonia bacterium]
MSESRSGSTARYGTHGRVLIVDLTTRTARVEEVAESVYRQFLGGYGLGAYLMWKHFPPGTDALAPQACFAIVSGLLTGLRTPFSGRIQIVGKSPLTGTWADSNSGGSVASHLRRAGFDALVVSGRASAPTVLVIRDGDAQFEPAGDLWGKEIPPVFDALRARFGGHSEVGVSAVGPAGERQSCIASVMNDRYHAFGRQGFGAIYGSKNLKAIVVSGSGEVPIADPNRFRALCQEITQEYKSALSWRMRLMVWFAKPKRYLGFVYRLFTRLGLKVEAPQEAMRQLWSDRGTTAAVALSIENGDAPLKNWKGAGAVDFPLATKSYKLDGAQVDKYITKKLSCGDCPAPCKGIVAVKNRGLSDVRRPDYETIIGFGANLLNDDIELVTACHDACNRYGLDAVSASATLAWVCEAVEVGILTAHDLDGIAMRWGNGEGALALTVKMGTGEGCGEWLRHGLARAAAHVGKGSERFAVHVHGSEPAYHDSRFTSLMGVTYISDPTPGRHTAGSASWNETFNAKFPMQHAVDPKEVKVSWHGTEGKGVAQAHFSNAHQVMNGLGLCMFTSLTGGLPWMELVNSLTGWTMTEKDLLVAGERIQNLRAAFNLREGIKPSDFQPHPRMLGEGDGLLQTGPLKGIKVPLAQLKEDYYRAMHWNPQTGHLQRSHADTLGLTDLLEGYVDA